MKTSLRLTVAACGLAIFTVSTATVQAEDYAYTTNNGTITITKYTGPGGDVNFPGQINGLPVTTIGFGAFSGCSSLTSITIPESVMSVGEVAFAGSYDLRRVYFKGNAPSIGNGAFSEVWYVTVYYLPGTTGWGTTFGGVPTMLWDPKLGCAYSVTNATITITEYLGPGGSLTIPDTIEGLPVTSIRDGAFGHCTNLTSITIPDSVTSMGRGTFHDCTGLTNATIGNGVTSLDPRFSMDGWTFVYGSFQGCTNLAAVTIGNSVTNIGEQAFAGCSSLASVTISKSITTIGYKAFSGCTSLTSITIPNSVTSIGAGAFSSCTALMALTVDTNNACYSSLDGVLFDKSQTALQQCPGSRAEDYAIPNGVTRIEERAFASCTSLSGITIPGSVTSIGWCAFSRCSSLTGITIPNSVTSIGAGAFSYCTALTSVTIPNGVRTIADGGEFMDGVFEGCTSLTSIVIPGSVTYIGFEAFGGCSSLTGVVIPDSVTSIGRYAFDGCTSLTRVCFEGNAAECDSSIFAGADNATVYYLSGTTGWVPTFGGRPTAPWLLPYPVVLTAAPNFGIQTNAFGFRISWATNVPVVVEVSTTLASPVWSPVSTNTLTDGWSYFSDAEWTNYPSRFYRIRSQ